MPEIGNLHHLRTLALQENCLHGTIPPELWKLRRLKHLNLEANGLSGHITDEMYSSQSLVSLKLADNSNEDSCNHTDGTAITVSSKGLEGEILSSNIGQLNHLIEISIYFNNFNGSISAEIGNLKHLGESMRLLIEHCTQVVC